MHDSSWPRDAWPIHLMQWWRWSRLAGPHATGPAESRGSPQGMVTRFQPARARFQATQCHTFRLTYRSHKRDITSSPPRRGKHYGRGAAHWVVVGADTAEPAAALSAAIFRSV